MNSLFLMVQQCLLCQEQQQARSQFSSRKATKNTIKINELDILLRHEMLNTTIVRSDLFIEQLKSVLVAGAQPNVSPKDIDSFEFSFPKSQNEQHKIGQFFQSLDRLITLHQREYLLFEVLLC